MTNVFIEPLPKGDGAITGYQVEFADGKRSLGPFKTQEEAITAAKKENRNPLVARVRKTEKGNPDHWRPA